MLSICLRGFILRRKFVILGAQTQGRDRTRPGDQTTMLWLTADEFTVPEVQGSDQ